MSREELKLYRAPVSLTWWTRKRSYLLFVLRELSSVLVAWFVVFLLMLVYAVGSGAAAYQEFLDFAAHPVVIVVNLIALAFLVLHTVTWLALAPRAMVVRLGPRLGDPRVPPVFVLAGHYGAWLVLSAIVVWLVLR